MHKLLSDRSRDSEDARGIILRQGKKLHIRYVADWRRKIDKLNDYRLVEKFKEMLITTSVEKNNHKTNKTTSEVV